MHTPFAANYVSYSIFKTYTGHRHVHTVLFFLSLKIKTAQFTILVSLIDIYSAKYTHEGKFEAYSHPYVVLV